MGTSLRRVLLMLAALVAVYPPYRPPGSRSGGSDDDFDTALCPSCGMESDSKSGNRYWCERCGRYFKP